MSNQIGRNIVPAHRNDPRPGDIARYVQEANRLRSATIAAAFAGLGHKLAAIAGLPVRMSEAVTGYLARRRRYLRVLSELHSYSPQELSADLGILPSEVRRVAASAAGRRA